MRRLTGSIALLLLTGCASLGVRTDGTSGPIAWRVENIAVVTREVRGNPREGQAFTVVLKNVGDRTITFTRIDEMRYRPQTDGSSASYSGRWVLRPGVEWKWDRFASLACPSESGCTDSGSSQALFRMIFTGTDDEKRPIEARLDITLPPAVTGRAPIVR